MLWKTRFTGTLLALVPIAGGESPPAAPGQPLPNAYVDAPLPGATARVFAAGVVAVSRGEGIYSERPVFSPDLRECYFDVTDYKNKVFTSYALRRRGGEWSRPEPAFFSRQGGVQASFSADGSRLFFTAPSPQDAKVRGIWMAERNGDGWSHPEFLTPPVNQPQADASFACATRSGALYFLRRTRDGEAMRTGVFRAHGAARGHYESAEPVQAFQSTATVVMGDFYVSLDERTLVIYSTLPGNLGAGDLYVSFRRGDLTWSPLQSLGAEVNTPGYDFAPSLSPDGRFLFFTRDHERRGDVYWISSQVLDRLKRE